MTKIRFVATVAAVFLTGALINGFAEEEMKKEALLKNEKGVLTCSGGGTQYPLFNQDCNTLTLSRLTVPGGIKYEAICADRSGKTFYLACDVFAFEFDAPLKSKDLLKNE